MRESLRSIHIFVVIDLSCRLRVLSVLRYWVDNFYDDFRSSPDLLETLVAFLDNVIALSGNKQFVTQIKAALDKKRDGAERLRVAPKAPPPPAILPDGWPMGGRWTLMDIEPVEVARQLSLVGLELLQNITPSELLGTAWTKADKHTRSPNVMKSIAHFNKVRYTALDTTTDNASNTPCSSACSASKTSSSARTSSSVATCCGDGF